MISSYVRENIGINIGGYIVIEKYKRKTNGKEIYMEGSKWRKGINIEMRRQLNGKTSPAEKWETVKLNAASLHNPKLHQVVCHKCVFYGVCIPDILRIIV